MLFAPAMLRAPREVERRAPRARVTPSDRLPWNVVPDSERDVMPIECGMPERMPTPEYERTLNAGACDDRRRDMHGADAAAAEAASCRRR